MKARPQLWAGGFHRIDALTGGRLIFAHYTTKLQMGQKHSVTNPTQMGLFSGFRTINYIFFLKSKSASIGRNVTVDTGMEHTLAKAGKFGIIYF